MPPGVERQGVVVLLDAGPTDVEYSLSVGAQCLYAGLEAELVSGAHPSFCLPVH